MSPRVRALLFVVLAAACWGSGTVLSKAAVSEFPPLTLLGGQLLVSAGILGLAVRWAGESTRNVDRRLVALGALNPGLAYALSLIGLTMIPASASVLVWAMEPILILLVAGLVLGERPGVPIVGLSIAALIGLSVAVGGQAGGAAVPGLALSVAGVACCVGYSVATRRWIATSPSTLAVVALQDVVALAIVAAVLVAGSLAGFSTVPAALTPAGIASAVASGILYYGAAYLLYLDALRVLPVSIAAIAFYLVPVFGIAAASLAGETLTTIQWVGTTATILAVLGAGVVDVRRSTSRQPALGQP